MPAPCGCILLTKHTKFAGITAVSRDGGDTFCCAHAQFEPNPQPGSTVPVERTRTAPVWDDEEEVEAYLKDPPDPGPLADCVPLRNWVTEIEDNLKSGPSTMKRLLQIDDEDVVMDIQENTLRILDGCNENEVKLVAKSPKNKGFFEKFFHFFS